jgi:hypothetical protein
MSGRWSDCSARRTVSARLDLFERDKDRDRVVRMQLQIADHAQGFVELQDIEAAGDGERSDFLEVDHAASLVPAGITPGLFAVRLGGGTMSAVTFRA